MEAAALGKRPVRAVYERTYHEFADVERSMMIE